MSVLPKLPACCLQILLLAAAAAAQYQVPAGYAAAPVFTDSLGVLSIRAIAQDTRRGDFYQAFGNVLLQRPDPVTRLPLFTLNPGDSIGTVRYCAGLDRLFFTSLLGGTVYELDPATAAVTPFGGMINAFDLAADGQGRLLLAANPNWPQPGNTGIWHVGRGRAPREILRLSGPSGPLAFDASDNLIVAELGAVVPPPPGAVRLLRFPAARLAAVLASASATLSYADADLVGTGWPGAFGLAVDDLDRVYVTDANGSGLRRSAPGTLQPEPAPFCGLPGFGLQLQFVAGSDPRRRFAAWQPDAGGSFLLVVHTDFSLRCEVARLQPQRPQLGIAPPAPQPPGNVLFACTAAPPQALVALLLGGPVGSENVAAVVDGAPLWLGLSPPLLAAVAVADAQGAASIALRHPGGFAATFAAQLLALGTPGSGAHGTSAPTSLTLLP